MSQGTSNHIFGAFHLYFTDSNTEDMQQWRKIIEIWKLVCGLCEMNWYFTPFLRGSWEGTWHFWKHWCCTPCRIQSGPHGVTTRAGFFEDGRGRGYQLKSHSSQISSVHWSLGANWSLATWKILTGKHFLLVKKPAKPGWNGRSFWSHHTALLLPVLHKGWAKTVSFSVSDNLVLFTGIKYT